MFVNDGGSSAILNASVPASDAEEQMRLAVQRAGGAIGTKPDGRDSRYAPPPQAGDVHAQSIELAIEAYVRANGMPAVGAGEDAAATTAAAFRRAMSIWRHPQRDDELFTLHAAKGRSGDAE
ncbi:MULTISPECIES: hypothetical protein [Rhodomicrobium]|uniref:hypothetical protein n=1 Tax=Rhodomicrobium TaxID=1068 RepID=UPI000B4A6E4A|nr:MULTISPECIES: hypothetical protein [Rhodomicrobium]